MTMTAGVGGCVGNDEIGASETQFVGCAVVDGGVAGYIVIGAYVVHSTCGGDSVLVTKETVVVGFIVIGVSVACVVVSVLVATEAVVVGGAVEGSNIHMLVLCVGEAIEIVAVGAPVLELSHSQLSSSSSPSSSCSSSPFCAKLARLVDPTAVGINEAATVALGDD